VKPSRHQQVARRKRRIGRRLRPRTWTAQQTPMYRASGIQYEHSDRVRGLASGGIGAMAGSATGDGMGGGVVGDGAMQVSVPGLPPVCRDAPPPDGPLGPLD